MPQFRIANYWYRPTCWNIPVLLLLPFSWLFHLCIRIRRWLYRANILKTQHFDAPVIVVGNITVGGTGKTPFVIWLESFLRSQGFRPGIVSRGVGGKKHKKPYWITQQDEPEEVGDEAILIYKNTVCPMVICANRAAAVRSLLQKSNCNIVISDDGLQHYRLGRDIEIVMVDSDRQFGNQCLLPAGPLREPVSRLKDVDFVIENRGSNVPCHSERSEEPRDRDSALEIPRYARDDNEARDDNNKFILTLEPSELISLQQKEKINLAKFPHKKIHALAGIGHPQRFFQSLQAAGFDIVPHIFPDHYLYQPQDIEFADDLPVIMTEKDAVKCTAFATDHCWYLSIIAKMNDKFILEFLAKLKSLEVTHEGEANFT